MTTLIKIAKIVRECVSLAIVAIPLAIVCFAILLMETDFYPFIIIGWPIFIIFTCCFIITLILVIAFFWPEAYLKRLKRPQAT